MTVEAGHVERAAVWEDFIDIFYAPSAVFRRREQGSFLIPIAVVALAVGTLFYLNSGALRPLFEAEFDRQIAAALRANPTMPAESVEGMRVFAERVGQVGTFFAIPVVMLCVGLVTWAVAKLFDATLSLQTAMVVAAYAYVPRIIEAVVNGLQGLVLDPSQLDGRFRLSLGPARFFDPDTTSPLLLAIIGRVDAITLWITVLVGIGLAVNGRLSRGRAATAAGIIWLAGAIPNVLQAIRMS